MENIGEKIKLIRDLEKQTRKEFFEETGVKVGTLRDIEGGKYVPRYSSISSIFHSEKYKKYTMWVIFGNDFDQIEQVNPIKSLDEKLNS
jgi:transcriptional regulator with XRE-family HTH domain